jgi:single-strand selective monofunctional uracil DNA glycosylase
MVKARPPAARKLRAILDTLSDRLDTMAFGPPVTHVYNPLRYTTAIVDAWLDRFATGSGRVLFVGMNPGPWGMAQTGIPFGEVDAVRDWMGLDGPVGKPFPEHPKRPIDGLNCTRHEISGQRLWGFFRDTFGSADAFYAKAFVTNWCPLSFMEASGANRTPDKLPAAEREPLFAACDEALAAIIETLAPCLVIGVGGFAEKRARLAVAMTSLAIPIGAMLHPSPASPRANRDWAGTAASELRALGLDWPFPAPGDA